MKLRVNNIVIGGAALLLTATCAFAGRYNGAASGDVLPQNIFNVKRRAPGIRDDIVIPQVNFFTLTGTMSYDGRSLAFFDGTTRRFQNKVLKPGEKLGGYTVTEIANDLIKLQAPGRAEVTLRVGSRLAELIEN